MSAKYSVLIAACFMLAFTQISGQGLKVVDGKIKITIGTTSGCGDTMKFIRDHLVKAYRLYGNFLEVKFVPWGRTTLSSDGVFWCQFGERDCWANRLHRCVLKMLKNNQDAQVRYMTCEFSKPFPAYLKKSYVCAQAVGVNKVDVEYCVAHPGDNLDRAAQAASAGPMSKGSINFVPYIVFNGVEDRAISTEARVRFSSMICFALAKDPSTGVTNC